MTAQTQPHAGMSQRIVRELKQYALVSAYLYVCFGAILFYKVATLKAVGIEYAPYGLAAVKALILAKFMLVGHAVGLGEQLRHKPLVYCVLLNSFVFVMMLAILSVIEETIRGVLNGATVSKAILAFGGGTWLQIVAVCVLMWLILLPYFAYRQIGRRLGEAEMHRILYGTG